jgi:DNA-binding MarR family transcriptional regulator
MPDVGDPHTRLDAPARAGHRWRLRYAESEAMVAALRLQRAQSLIEARINVLLKPLDLNVVRYEVLTTLAFSEGGSMQMGQISGWMMVHPTSVTHNVDRLEAQGYVRRVTNPRDKRGVLTQLTSSGYEVVERATALLVADRFCLGELTRADHVHLNRILRKITAPAGE